MLRIAAPKASRIQKTKNTCVNPNASYVIIPTANEAMDAASAVSSQSSPPPLDYAMLAQMRDGADEQPHPQTKAHKSDVERDNSAINYQRIGAFRFGSLKPLISIPFTLHRTRDSGAASASIGIN